MFFDGESGASRTPLMNALGTATAESAAAVSAVQVVKANNAPPKGTVWHRHEAEFHLLAIKS